MNQYSAKRYPITSTTPLLARFFARDFRLTQVIIAGDLAEEEHEGSCERRAAHLVPKPGAHLAGNYCCRGWRHERRQRPEAETGNGGEEGGRRGHVPRCFGGVRGKFAAAVGGRAATACMCFDVACSRPVNSVKELEGLL